MFLQERIASLIENMAPDGSLHERYFELGNIYRFLELPDKISKIEQFNSSAKRTYYANALERSVTDLDTLKNILSKKAPLKGFNEKSLYVYREAEEYLVKQKDSCLDINLIAELQKLISSQVNKSTEDFDLFNIHYHKLPEVLSEESAFLLKELFSFINNDRHFDPVSQSWILHFEILRIKPYGSDAPILARLLQYFWLSKQDMHFDGLISLEQELFQQRNEYYELQNFATADPLELMCTQVHFGRKLYAQNLERIKQTLRMYFRKQVEFDDATPRQKNLMNYIFERGYRLKLFTEGLLNKRQELIMYIIHHKGFVSTKELTEEFECNRKTIQRDFNELLKLNLVHTMGNGASLRYSVNIRENVNSEMYQFMPEFLKARNNQERVHEHDEELVHAETDETRLQAAELPLGE